MQAIEICGLRKKYRRIEALRGIDLSLRRGSFFGLLGPNGAGKTTLIKVIVGLAHPTAGTIRIFGRDIRKDPLYAKSQIGLSPQEPNVDRYFTVRRTLEFQGGYYGLARRERRLRAAELMEQFGLADKAEDEYWRLSGGMQKRVLIARSLMSRPAILILDEPTAGIDVEQRHELWRYLRELHRSETTILLTTHYIDEAEELCERVGIIHHGRIVEEDSPQALIARHSEHDFSLEEAFLKLTGHSIHEDETLDRLPDAH